MADTVHRSDAGGVARYFKDGFELMRCAGTLAHVAEPHMTSVTGMRWGELAGKKVFAWRHNWRHNYGRVTRS